MSSWSRSIYHRQNGRYYKYKNSGSNADILDGDTESSLDRNSSEFHDHFFKRNGIWYVQSKIDGSHLFEEIRPGIRGVNQIQSGEYLDRLLGELQRLS